ncbi:MAG: AEC family transporter [Herpetosiphon sp.]
MVATLRAFSEVLLPVAVIAAIGYVLGRAFPLDRRTLNRISIYGLSPCLIFVTLLRTEINADVAVRLALLMLSVVLVTAFVSFLIACWMRLPGPQRSGFMLASTFMNSGNYGLPATRFAFGELGFQYGVIGYLTQTVLSQTLAVYLASAGQGNRRAAIYQVFRMPLVYAGLLAVTLRLLGIKMDESNGILLFGLYRGIRLLADATLPMLLVILGTQLNQPLPVGHLTPLSVAALLRLLGSIPLAYGMALLLGLHALPLRVGIVQAAMPTAVNMTILALEFDAWPEFVSNTVVITTLGSLVTLTALFVVLR